MKSRTRRATHGSGAVLAGLAALAACGAPGGSASTATSGSTTFEGRGPITYVAGKDSTGSVQMVLDRWNKAHPKEKVTFIQLPTDPDAQRQQMIQNAETKSDAYTVLSLDAVWTSEFAAHRWIDRLPEERFPLRQMLKPVVETGEVPRRRVRGPGELGRRHAVLPHRSAEEGRHRRASGHLGRDEGGLRQGEEAAGGARHVVLRRAVPEVRGPDGQLRRGRELRGRDRHRRERQAGGRTPPRRRRAWTSWSARSRTARSRRRPSPTWRRTVAGRSRQASSSSCAVAVRVLRWHRRRTAPARSREVRCRTAARPRRDPAPPAWEATTWPSRPPPRTRPRRWTS